jgi:hypothetical protein
MIMPRIAWCATGPLAFLPIHVAGIYDLKDPSKTIRESDSIVSSYTPSLSALVHSRVERSQATTHTGQDRSPQILVVSQSATPRQKPRPCTTEEAEAVWCHSPSNVSHLAGGNAIMDAVLNAMQKHEWVYLVSHGTQDPLESTKSAFLLEDDQLVLSQLIDTSFPRAELLCGAEAISCDVEGRR